MAQERSASALRSFQNTANEPHCGDLGGGLQKASGAVQRHGDSCPCWKVLEGGRSGQWACQCVLPGKEACPGIGKGGDTLGASGAVGAPSRGLTPSPADSWGRPLHSWASPPAWGWVHLSGAQEAAIPNSTPRSSQSSRGEG